MSCSKEAYNDNLLQQMDLEYRGYNDIRKIFDNLGC